VLIALLVSGCATTPPSQLSPPRASLPNLQGSYHHVRRGETLWRIATSYGVEVAELARVNRLARPTDLKVGQRLFIPLPRETAQFLWPLRGSLRRSAGAHGVEIAAAPGSLVRASRSGRVAVATQRLSGWGRAVVIDHVDGFVTVYANLDQTLVAPGAEVRQGTPVGSLGSRALHFEIRLGVRPKNALALLPTK
jgi:murein DD-endopeptidase MepM/ murein hydrolase activator NlpD